MNSGYFISFEGIDGSGKSTQAELLTAKLQAENFPAVLFREPGGTTISEKIRDILLDKDHGTMTAMTEFLLYAASRSQLVKEKIEPALSQGQIVICDRFADSSLAYQGFGRKVNKEFVQRVNMRATENICPDMTFIIDVDLSTAHSRSAEIPDRLEQESAEFKKRVRKGYHRIADEDTERVFLVAGNRPVEQIHEEILQSVLPEVKHYKRVVT